MERGTTLTCKHCRQPFQPKNRNGVLALFCKRACLDAHRNAKRLKATARKPRLPKAKRQTLDELSAALGLPKGTYPAGALAACSGKRGMIEMIPPGERAETLRQAAENLGLTKQDEGAFVQAARATSYSITSGRRQP